MSYNTAASLHVPSLPITEPGSPVSIPHLASSLSCLQRMYEATWTPKLPAQVTTACNGEGMQGIKEGVDEGGS